MPVFVNYQKKIFVITSYKVAYSTLFKHTDESFKYLNHRIDYSIFKHFIKHYNYKRFQLIRHPYNRFTSLFKDKFRAVPDTISETGFKWQPVHYIVLPHLGLDKNSSNSVIAEAFLSMNINDFILILPKIYLLDGHLAPQIHSCALRLTQKLYIPVRINNYYKLENQIEEISKITDIDLNIKQRNVTNSKNLLQDLNSKSISILSKLYKEDFALGNYRM